MSNTVLHFPDRRAEVEQATAWIVKLERGLRGNEHEELSRWLEQQRNRAALVEIAELWDRMDMLAELGELFPLREEHVAGHRTAVWSVAAALVALFGIAIAAFHFLQSDGFTNTYVTAVGEQKTVELPDHSKILLNTNTDLQVEFTDSARLIKMTRGEANFEVAKDPSRPFIVRAGGIDFVAVGTAFNVRADARRGVSLTVTEGRVHVQKNRNATLEIATGPVASSAAITNNSARTDIDVVVGADMGVVIDPATESVSALEPTEVVGATAWQQGMAVFEHTPLKEVAAEFSRYLTTPIVIVDSELADVRVSGFFRVRDIDGLAIALKKNFDIDVQKNNDAIVLSVARTK